VQFGVPGDGRREGRGDGAQPDGAGREVDGVVVLGLARVRLDAFERAQLGEVLPGQVAEEVLDGVEGRRGVRLDGDAVTGLQLAEVERGEDRDHRGRGGLVAADLRAIQVRPNTVGVVDHVRREPQHATLDRFERGQLVSRQSTGPPRLHREHRRLRQRHLPGLYVPLALLPPWERRLRDRRSFVRRSEAGLLRQDGCAGRAHRADHRPAG
jgi:hypothetical protein